MEKNINKNLPKSPTKKNINENNKSNSNSDNKKLKKEKEDEKLKNIEIINLIKTVKSKYIIKSIFSCLKDDLILTIIVHNKEYQNLFEIDTDYYKNKSGKEG